MTEKKSNSSIGKTLLMVLMLCPVCSIVVVSSVMGLESRQQAQRTLDKQRNILVVIGLMQPGTDIGAVAGTFVARILSRLVNLVTGELLGKDPVKLNQTQALKDPQQSITLNAGQDPAGIKRRSNLAEIYLVHGTQQWVKQMVLPICGNGLWSMTYAFVALDVDGRTVKDTTYYSQGETPELGGEVENPNQRQQFIGKQMLDDNSMPALRMVKGGVRADNLHAVDGLSGATLTSSDVQHSFDFWVGELGFGPLLKKVREGGLNNG